MSGSEGLAATARAGDALATLRALRDRIAADLDSCDSARDVASLSQRLMDVVEKIAALEKAQPAAKGTPLDELATRRSGKKSPARPARAARS